MPRMQVYLPDELYRAVKERGLAASELLQEAVRLEIRRRDLTDAADEYATELSAEAGEPTEAEIERARTILDRLTRDPDQAVG